MSVPSFEEWVIPPTSNKPFRGYVENWSVKGGALNGCIVGVDALNGRIWRPEELPARLGAIYKILSPTVVETQNYHYILQGPEKVR